MGNQLLAEIHSADRVDLVMAFIRRSGIAPLLTALRAYVERGSPLRILTTTYTGSTEARALDALRDYQVGRELIHLESQSETSAEADTGVPEEYGSAHA